MEIFDLEKQMAVAYQATRRGWQYYIRKIKYVSFVATYVYPSFW